MKKFVLLAVVLLSSVGVFAQREVGSINIQPKVGVNIADLTDVDGSDPRIGFVIGAEGEYQLTDMVSLTAGLLYSQQGAKCEYSENIAGVNINVEEKTKVDYINVPILANVYVIKGLAVKLGVQPAFKVHDNDIKGVKSFDFSIPVGVSYEYSNFQLDARYNWGLTKIADHGDSKNSVFQVTLGYKFDL